MSILADKKIAVADEKCFSIRRMPKLTIPDLIARRVDPSVPKAQRMTYEEIAERSGGRISSTHVNDLRNGKRNPQKLTVDKIIGLARGLIEAPEVVFEAATGTLQSGLKDATVRQVLAEVVELTAKERENHGIEFALRMLRERVEEAINSRNHTATPR